MSEYLAEFWFDGNDVHEIDGHYETYICWPKVKDETLAAGAPVLAQLADNGNEVLQWEAVIVKAGKSGYTLRFNDWHSPL